MIPMIGILLCIYLVFKGFEIFQIALCAQASASRTTGIVLGALGLILSVLIGGFFALSFLTSSVPQIPTR
jgi:hypothetical protein